MKGDYHQRFTRVAEQIARQPFLTLAVFEIGEGLPLDTIRALEAQYGYALGPALSDFYSQVNGVRLKWHLREDLTDEEFRTLPEPLRALDPSNTDDDYASAQIRILPLQELFGIDWAVGTPWMNGLAYHPQFGFHGEHLTAEQFLRRVRPFDLVSGYLGAALIFGDTAAPTVTMLFQHYSSHDESKTTDVASYLHFILDIYGASDARKHWLYQFGGWETIVTYTPGDPTGYDFSFMDV